MSSDAREGRISTGVVGILSKVWTLYHHGICMPIHIFINRLTSFHTHSLCCGLYHFGRNFIGYSFYLDCFVFDFIQFSIYFDFLLNSIYFDLNLISDFFDFSLIFELLLIYFRIYCLFLLLVTFVHVMQNVLEDSEYGYLPRKITEDTRT